MGKLLVVHKSRSDDLDIPWCIHNTKNVMRLILAITRKMCPSQEKLAHNASSSIRLASDGIDSAVKTLRTSVSPARD